MKTSTLRLVPLLPWLGLALIVAGALLFFATRDFDLLVNIPLALGALALLSYALLRPATVRALVGGRQTRYGLNTFLAVAFFAAIAVLLYWIAYQNTDWRLDVTEAGEFTPLPETQQLLKQLDEPVRAIGFFTFRTASQQAMAATLLESLRAYYRDLTYEFVDPELDPLLAQQYEISRDGTLVFVKGTGEDAPFARSASLSDRDIHSALLQVINPRAKFAYFIAGHGERAIDSFTEEGLGNIVSDLTDLGFTVEDLNLAVAGSVPEDASVIILVGQQAPLLPEDLEAIRSYLAAGGAALIMRDVAADDPVLLRVEDDGLNELLADEWGLALRPDVIVEPEMAIFGQQNPLLFLSFEFGPSAIVSGNLEDLGVYFPIARSVSTTALEGVTPVNLVLTSASSWGETNFQDFNPDEGDALGPVTPAASAENEETGARLVVMGDADFVSNQFVYSNGNYLLFTNAVNWLAGDETALELTPREVTNRAVAVPQDQLGMLQTVSLFAAPLLVAIVGVSVWLSRRRNR
jgi:ABC-type uncharacterized transport system involved in gliding motility auxiliary subunit